MTNAAVCFFLLTLFLLSMTTIAALRFLPQLATTNAVLMGCVPLLGAPILQVFGHELRAGSVFTAVVMFGLTLKYLMAGARETHAGINYTLFTMIIVFGSAFLLQESNAMSPEFGTEPRAAGARFISFWLVQTLFIYLLDRFSAVTALWRVPLIAIAMEALDSVIFYPCAFAGYMSPKELLNLTFFGFAARTMVILLSIPFLVWFRQRLRLRTMAPS
jgi:hypothetical protein